MLRWIQAFFVALAIAVVVVLLVNAAAALQHWIAVHSGTVPVMCKDSPCAVQPYYNNLAAA